MRPYLLPLPLLLTLACGTAPTTSAQPLTNVSNATPDPISVAPDTEPTRSVRDIDWHNRTYNIPSDGTEGQLMAGVFPVVDGEHGWRRGDDHGWLKVGDVAFGDIDGDRREDVIVELTVNTGGSGNFDTALVYAIRGDELVSIGEIPGGDRAYGGLKDIDIVGAQVRIQRFKSEVACCPEAIQHETWVHDGARMIELTSERRQAPVSR